MHRIQCFMRKMLVFIFYTYTLGLAIYLGLRVMFEDQFWWLGLINAFSFYVFIPVLLILPLAFVLKQKPLILLTVFLTAIWLMWISPYFLPKSAHAASKNDIILRIATFNIWGDNQRLNEVEHYLNDLKADIVLLQEVPEVIAEDQLSGIKAVYQYRFIQGQAWNSAILSQHPFVNTENIASIPSTPQRVVINLQGRDIAIYNVHIPIPFREVSRIALPAKLPWFMKMPLAYDDEERNKVIRAVLAQLDQETLPYIIAGDFNTSAQSGTYTEIARHGKDTFREAGTGLGFSWPINEIATFPSFVPPLIRIDYIWHSDDFEAVTAQQGPELGSDHLPLWATLRVKPANP